MKWLIFIAVFLSTNTAKAVITYDSTACAGGIITSCPSGVDISSASTTATATTTFSTGVTNLITIYVTGQPGGASASLGTPTISSGSFAVPITLVKTACATSFACAGVWYAYPSATLSTVTVTATLTSASTGNSVLLYVVPFGSPTAIGRGNSFTTGTTIQGNENGGLEGSISMGIFTDGHSATARTANSVTTIGYSMALTSAYTAFIYANSPAATQGNTALIGVSNPPATVSNDWAGVFIEIIDATVVATPDQQACGICIACGSAGGTGSQSLCPGNQGTGSVTRNAGNFSTMLPVELLIAIGSVQGIGVTVTVTDSGIAKSIGWTLINKCANTTTTDTEIWGAVTSSAVSSKLVTFTFGGTPASSTVMVYPYYTSMKTLPTNFQCGATNTGPAAVSLTAVGSGSMIVGGGLDQSGTSGRTQIATPQSWIARSMVGGTGISWQNYAWSSSIGALTFGTSAPSSTFWAFDGVEVQVKDSSTSNSNSGMMHWWGD